MRLGGAVRGPGCASDENTRKPDSLGEMTRTGAKENVEAEDPGLKLSKAEDPGLKLSKAGQLCSTRQERLQALRNNCRAPPSLGEQSRLRSCNSSPYQGRRNPDTQACLEL